MRDIRAGHYCVGARLSGEREMAEQFAISVGTLRKALDIVAEKGFLRRVQGSGNYVEKPKHDQSLYAFFRLEREGSTGLPTARVLDVSYCRAPQNLSVERAWRIRRIRALDGIDVAIEEIFANLPETPKLTADALSQSLYLTYRQTYNLWVTQVNDRVGVAQWPEWAKLGQLAQAGHVERTALSNTGGIVEISRTWFDANEAKYISRLT